MVIYLCDASSILRYVDNEPGRARIEDVLQETARGAARTLVSAVHWGEVGGKIYKRLGETAMREGLARLKRIGFEIVPVHPDQAVRAGVIKGSLKIPYADAFGVALAEEHPHSILITADFDFKVATHLIFIEFLPQKSPTS
jgi:predicted nucleic acid-binding protein